MGSSGAAGRLGEATAETRRPDERRLRTTTFGTTDEAFLNELIVVREDDDDDTRALGAARLAASVGIAARATEAAILLLL